MRILQEIGKIIYNVFVFAVLGIVVIAVIAAVVAGASYANLNANIEAGKAYYQENYIFRDNCYIDSTFLKDNNKTQFGESVSGDMYSDIVELCLDKYPENIRSFISDNWSIVFTPTMPNFATEYLDECSPEKNSAVTVPDIQTVFIYTNNVNSIPYILTHEFGHVLAFEYGCVEYTSEFEDLYNIFKFSFTEKSPYAIPGYAVSCSSEFFASAMSAYVTDPEWLWLDAPGAADYMEELLKEKPYNNEWEKFMLRTRGLLNANAN